jgi:hypothetical protein
MLNQSTSQKNLFAENGQLTLDAKGALVQAINEKILDGHLEMVVRFCDVRFEDITSRDMTGAEQVVAVIDHFQETNRLNALLKEIQRSNKSFAGAFSRGPYSDGINKCLESQTPDDATIRSKIIDDLSSKALNSANKLTDAGLNILLEVIGQSFTQQGFLMALSDAEMNDLYKRGDTYLTLRTRALKQCEDNGSLSKLLGVLNSRNPKGFIPRLEETTVGCQIVASFCSKLDG